jgi:ribosomal protein S1
LWETYDGYVKLKYNYGVFVTVKGVEWLLHKSQIKVPKNLQDRKWIYTIGDKIIVKAQEFKVIDGTKRIVWTQL